MSPVAAASLSLRFCNIAARRFLRMTRLLALSVRVAIRDLPFLKSLRGIFILLDNFNQYRSKQNKMLSFAVFHKSLSSTVGPSCLE